MRNQQIANVRFAGFATPTRAPARNRGNKRILSESIIKKWSAHIKPGETVLPVPFCERGNDKYSSDPCSYTIRTGGRKFDLQKLPVEGECIRELCGGARVDFRDEKWKIDFSECNSGDIADLRNTIAATNQLINTNISEIDDLKVIKDDVVAGGTEKSYKDLATGVMSEAVTDMKRRLDTCEGEKTLCDGILVQEMWKNHRDKDLLNVANAADSEPWFMNKKNEYGLDMKRGVYAKFPAIGTCSVNDPGRTTLLECGYQVNKLFTDNNKSAIVRAECAAPVSINKNGFTPLPYFAKCSEHTYAPTGNIVHIQNIARSTGAEMYTFPGQNQLRCEKPGRVHLAECLNELAKASCLSDWWSQGSYTKNSVFADLEIGFTDQGVANLKIKHTIDTGSCTSDDQCTSGSCDSNGQWGSCCASAFAGCSSCDNGNGSCPYCDAGYYLENNEGRTCDRD